MGMGWDDEWEKPENPASQIAYVITACHTNPQTDSLKYQKKKKTFFRNKLSLVSFCH